MVYSLGEIMVQINDLNVKEKSQWCPGCGNFAIVGALKNAFVELGIEQRNVVISSGIGCSGKTPHYLNVYGFEGLHGRSLPIASGIKLANDRLTVIAEGGDGDGYGIGSGHFIHIMRRNYDLTYIVHDNQIYGLTTGQASPTSQLGMKTKTTPNGVIEKPFNPIAAAIVGGATFVARTFAGDMNHLKTMIKEAITHKGFALVDVFQPCVTFNKLNTYDFFTKRVYKLQESGHDTNDKIKAMGKAFEAEATNYEKLPMGIFYKENRPTYEDSLPMIKERALVEHDLGGIDVSSVYEDLM
ncbi:2-oxoglutarate synthase subunit KorB [Candidatus Bilamarchaeum dharawalense]|uniref:2-oxoglutarate synthase subunit KorB n=1 Tax=Candidatus Bilamarchaeum dharawalense TaxID=2885759 RepID=A0A5E4LT21_9ARCH|nr:2-oxoglutarate synthase subunit KorB [Candidatus Bilamarchaeum dharawalense]